MKLINLKGQIVACQDEMRDFDDKDAAGNKTGHKTSHRVTQLSLIAQDLDKKPVVCLVRGWDLPSTFAAPQVGSEFVISEFRKIQVNPTSIEINL